MRAFNKDEYLAIFKQEIEDKTEVEDYQSPFVVNTPEWIQDMEYHNALKTIRIICKGCIIEKRREV